MLGDIIVGTGDADEDGTEVGPGVDSAELSIFVNLHMSCIFTIILITPMV